MKRFYQTLVKQHFEQNRQMLFLAGPRQVGKTTIAKACGGNDFIYLNWDKLPDRQKLIDENLTIFNKVQSDIAGHESPLIILDELHKKANWKNYLKGIFDSYPSLKILITGSAKLTVYRRGNDSLMGRYFPYRVHPLSVRELVDSSLKNEEISLPQKIDAQSMEQLIKFGGFPEPFLKANQRFSNKWQQLRHQQLFREDIRDLSKVQELQQLEILAELITQQATKQLNYSKLGQRLQIAATTVKRWVEILEEFYFCFGIRPWHKNVARSLVKEPKVYLWDWSNINDEGAKFENMVACHLLKAVHFWKDCGFGDYKLHYLRDLDKREVDFLISKDNQPWILVEVKASSKQSLNPNLKYFQQQLKAPHAIQVVFDLEYLDIDCFALDRPMIVPAKTFLSQLV